jgi:hypothetical protein
MTELEKIFYNINVANNNSKCLNMEQKNDGTLIDKSVGLPASFKFEFTVQYRGDSFRSQNTVFVKSPFCTYPVPVQLSDDKWGSIVNEMSTKIVMFLYKLSLDRNNIFSKSP